MESSNNRPFVIAVIVAAVAVGGVVVISSLNSNQGTANNSVVKQVTSSEGSAANPIIANTTQPSEDSSNAIATYKDGDYSATGGYRSPAGPETIGVTLTVASSKVTAVAVEPKTINSTSRGYQIKYKDGVSAVVVGKTIDELSSLGRVNGSSLTSEGFKKALESIKLQARA